MAAATPAYPRNDLLRKGHGPKLSAVHTDAIPGGRIESAQLEAFFHSAIAEAIRHEHASLLVRGDVLQRHPAGRVLIRRRGCEMVNVPGGDGAANSFVEAHIFGSPLPQGWIPVKDAAGNAELAVHGYSQHEIPPARRRRHVHVRALSFTVANHPVIADLRREGQRAAVGELD